MKSLKNRKVVRQLNEASKKSLSTKKLKIDKCTITRLLKT